MNRTKTAFGFICLATTSLSFFVPANCFAAPLAGAQAASANEVAEFKGTRKGFQNGVLLIERADGKAVLVQPSAQLAQTVEFEIRDNNLNLVQPGDAVSVASFTNRPTIPKSVATESPSRPIVSMESPRKKRRRLTNAGTSTKKSRR